MLITIIAFLLIAAGMLLGYFRGILSMLLAIGSLLLAALAAPFLPSLGRPVVGWMPFIPRALKPPAAGFFTALIVFLVLLIAGSTLLYIRSRRRLAAKLPRLTTLERALGCLFGGIWGLAMVLVIMTGITLIAQVEEAVTPGPAERQAKETTGTVSRPVTTEKTGKSPYQLLRTDIADSPFGGLVKTVNPLSETVSHAFADLMVVLNDPQRFECFRRHPDILSLTENPDLKAAADDPEIQQLLKNKDYYILLDHPKIAALVENRELLEQIRKIPFARIVAEIAGR